MSSRSDDAADRRLTQVLLGVLSETSEILNSRRNTTTGGN